jgi:hypothetical protein
MSLYLHSQIPLNTPSPSTSVTLPVLLNECSSAVNVNCLFIGVFIFVIAQSVERLATGWTTEGSGFESQSG